MNRTRILFSVLVAALALLAGSPAFADLIGSPDLLMLGAVAAPGIRPAFGWGRKREPMPTFTNVGANTTAYCVIPRYPRTIFGMILQLGGTTFTKALISRVELFVGDKSIWGPVSGAQLDAINLYLNGRPHGHGLSDYHLPIDFTLPQVKELAGEYIGGLDLTTLPDGVIRLEVDIGAATAPTLSGAFTWGAPQAGGKLGPLMSKLTRMSFPQAPAGDFYPQVDLRGAIIAREFWFGDVATAAVTAAQAEGVANAGDGAMGAVTVTARTPTGRRKLRFIEPASNAGRFMVVGPMGNIEGTGTVAVAYSANGLAFTLADGANDFVAGDGFTIDVLPLNTDQNTNLLEVKKNDETWYYRTDRMARLEQERNGRQPLTQLFVGDFLVDGRLDAAIDTQDASSLIHRLNVTSASILTLVAQTIARPIGG